MSVVHIWSRSTRWRAVLYRFREKRSSRQEVRMQCDHIKYCMSLTLLEGVLVVSHKVSIVAAFFLQVESLCEFPSLGFYNGQLKASPMLKCHSYPGLALFWPEGTACSMHIEHQVLADWVSGQQKDYFLSKIAPCPFLGSGLPLRCSVMRGSLRGVMCQSQQWTPL